MRKGTQYGTVTIFTGWKSLGIFLLLFLLAFVSCIKEDSEVCPPLQVNIIVKDKNYFNIRNVPLETRKSEMLPFREYIPTLHYVLRDAETGSVVEEQGLFSVTGSEATYSITFCECLPTGKYVLTVWGGMPDDTSLTDAALTHIIHANGKEGSDVYLTNDTIVYDYQNNHFTVDMERVTGKLLVQVVDLPATSRYMDERIDRIYERVNHLFNYLNPISVAKMATWESAEEIVVSSILAPSTGSAQSVLHLGFYNALTRSVPDFTPKDVNITLKRNELTTLKYAYSEERNDFFIYILMGDTWEMIYDLNIN